MIGISIFLNNALLNYNYETSKKFEKNIFKS